MLVSLAIRDILLIDRLELEFGQGLNTLTGETGAGKSILLDALGLVLGWRVDGDILRQGAESGEVVAEFVPPAGHPAWEVLAEAELPGDELILRRVVSSEGRKTAFVNDRRVSTEVLRALADVLVELHGQHDDIGLLSPRRHRGFLDAYAGHSLEPVRMAWASLREAQRQAEAEEDARREAERDLEFLQHAVRELSALAPEAGEEEALDTKRRRLQAAARIGEDVARAAAALGRDGAEAQAADALRWLENASQKAEGVLEAAMAATTAALDALGVANDALEDALEGLSHDPSELERTEERLFALRDLARKHRVGADDLPALLERMSARLSVAEGADEGRRLAGARVAEAKAAYESEASRLSAARVAAAVKLDESLAAELPPLKLERARFRTEIARGEAGPEGTDEVRFVAATNPGAPEGPIDKIASGGELSRFLLALKVCLAGGGASQVMIFDEIDRGVGGATADAVGRRLARLASTMQVLAVTHSPQVAARAGTHFRVEKEEAGGQTRSRVTLLEEEERVEELARMLAGETIGPEARAAALALLKGR